MTVQAYSIVCGCMLPGMCQIWSETPRTGLSRNSALITRHNIRLRAYEARVILFPYGRVVKTAFV